VISFIIPSSCQGDRITSLEELVLAPSVILASAKPWGSHLGSPDFDICNSTPGSDSVRELKKVPNLHARPGDDIFSAHKDGMVRRNKS
jgi:hypothetical protein